MPTAVPQPRKTMRSRPVCERVRGTRACSSQQCSLHLGPPLPRTSARTTCLPHWAAEALRLARMGCHAAGQAGLPSSPAPNHRERQCGGTCNKLVYRRRSVACIGQRKVGVDTNKVECVPPGYLRREAGNTQWCCHKNTGIHPTSRLPAFVTPGLQLAPYHRGPLKAPRTAAMTARHSAACPSVASSSVPTLK